jgi:Rrf2 family protein
MGLMAANRTTEYAVRALVVLALEGGQGRIRQAASLAKASGTPGKFMEQVLRNLKKGGFVVSRRGAGGGYDLARSAEQITLGEVVSWMEGKEEEGNGAGPLGEEWARLCAEAEAARRARFREESLRDLMEKVQARMAGKGRGSEYQI